MKIKRTITKYQELNFILFFFMSPLYVFVATLYFVMFRPINKDLSLRYMLNKWCKIHGV